MILKQTRYWHHDDETDPLKGPKGDTAFLKDNYKFSGIGSIFRTPKARFTANQIQEGAAKARFIVRIDEEGPWHKVTVVSKLPPKKKRPKQQTAYTGAGKVYPSPAPDSSTVTPDIFS